MPRLMVHFFSAFLYSAFHPKVVSAGGYDYGSQQGIRKEVYTFVLPDDVTPSPVFVKPPPIPPPRYKLIFIKAPSSDSPQVILPQIPEGPKEITKVYILQRKPLHPPHPQLHYKYPDKPTKPEVYYISYHGSKPAKPEVPPYTSYSVPGPHTHSWSDLRYQQEGRPPLNLPSGEVAPPQSFGISVKPDEQ